MSLASAVHKSIRKSPVLLKTLKRVFLLSYIQTRYHALEAKLIYSYIAGLDERIRKLEARMDLPVAVSAAPLVATDSLPRFATAVSQPATFNQFLEPEFQAVCRELVSELKFHRKLWEYAYIIHTLRKSGVLRQGARGLGFGVGKDPMVAAMVKAGCEIVATDLDESIAQEQGWAATNQFASKIRDLNEHGIVSDRLLRQHVTMKPVDMNFVPDDLKQGQFDFVWSACAFEHLGSLENGMKFVLESLKCIKPGGYVVHTTEFNVSSNDDTIETGGTVVYRKRDIEELARRVREAGGELELNFNLGDQPMDVYYDVAPYSDFNHLKLKLDRYIITSYGLLIRKR